MNHKKLKGDGFPLHVLWHGYREAPRFVLPSFLIAKPFLLPASGHMGRMWLMQLLTGRWCGRGMGWPAPALLAPQHSALSVPG